MDEITAGDVLLHYQNRFQEIAERTDDLRTKLRTAQTIAESGWHGPAGLAAQDKLTQLYLQLTGTAATVSDAMQMLDGIGSAIEEAISGG